MKHMDEGQLQAWLDRPRSGLPPEEHDAIARHLEACPPCRARLAELDQETDRLGHLMAADEMPDDQVPAFGEVVARARTLRDGDRRRRPWLATGWAASVVLALGVGWLGNEMIRRGDAPPPPARAASAETPEATGPTEAGDATSRDEMEAIEPATPAPAAPTVARSEPAETPERVALGDARTDTSNLVIRGRVLDQDGRPLEAAQISTADGAGTLSRADGTFEFALPNRRAGRDSSVTVQAQLLGYASEQRDLSLAGGRAVSTEFQLSQSAISLSELVVTGATAEQAAERARAAADAAPLAEAAAPSPGHWRSATIADATGLAGFRPRTIEGLEVVEVAIDTTAEGLAGPVVRVTQMLTTGERLVLLQGRQPVTNVPASDGATIERTVVGDVHVVAIARVEPETLRRLLAGLT